MAQVSHPLFARFYAWASPKMEAGGVAEHRRRLLAGLAGHVIEVGAGNGLNFAHYPATVARVVAVEPDPFLREAALANAPSAPVPVEVVAGVGERLPTREASFDAGVVSLTLCSVTDPHATVRELFRVIKPGGWLHFLEHVRAPDRRSQRVQRVFEATIWPHLFGGCHPSRDTVATIEQAGFRIQRLDRFRFPDARITLPTAPHVSGTAVRP